MGGSIHDELFLLNKAKGKTGLIWDLRAFHQWTKPQEFIYPFRHKEGSIELGLTQLTAGVEPTQTDHWTVHNHMVFQIRPQNLAKALGKNL